MAAWARRLPSFSATSRGRAPGGAWRAEPSGSLSVSILRSFADVRQEPHEPGPLDGFLDRSLERGAVAAALATEDLALAGAQLLQGNDVFVINERRPRTTLFGAEPAAVLPAPAELL